MKWDNAWKEVMEDRGRDYMAAMKFESILRESGAFSEVNVKKVEIPISGQTDGEYMNRVLIWSDGISRPDFEAIRGSDTTQFQ
jgi:hypothetical protein